MSASIPTSIRAIQVFEAVGRLGSVTQAATELCVSVGAISQQIKLLEAQLGVKLTERDGRGLRLTRLGRSYHLLTAEGFDCLRQARRTLNRQIEPTLITVSTLPSIALSWLCPRLDRWLEDHPGIDLRVESTHREPDLGLEGSEVDFRITYGSRMLSMMAPAGSQPLFRDWVVPMCSPTLLRSSKLPLRPAQLLAYPLIHIDWRPEFRGAPTWKEWFRRAGATRSRIPRGTTFTITRAAIRAAEEGRGVVLGQVTLTGEALRSGRLISPIDSRMPLPESYYLAWASTALGSDHKKQFMQWLVAEAQQAAPGARSSAEAEPV